MYSANKIIIADDHPLFREALSQSVASALDNPQVINCGTFVELQRAMHEHHIDCDLVLLDLYMPGAVGFSALHYLGLKCPDIPIAMISANEDPETIALAVEYGASGFIPKSADIEIIISAITHILDGNVWLPRDIESQLSTLHENNLDFSHKLKQLTPSQFRVLMMLVDGKKNKDIALEVSVTEATIKAHLTEIFKKLDVKNRTQAAMLASNHLGASSQTSN